MFCPNLYISTNSSQESRAYTLESIQSPLPSDHHLTLILGITQVHPRQIRGILLTPLLTKHEINDRQQLVLFQMINQMSPNILIENMTSSTA
jgi:hypothetical protein